MKKRIAALAMGAALATSAFMAPQAMAGTPAPSACEKGEKLVEGTHKIGDKVDVDIPEGFKAHHFDSQSPEDSLERDGDIFRIAAGEPGENTVTLTFEKGKRKNTKTATAEVKYTLDKCVKEKDKGKDKAHGSAFIGGGLFQKSSH